LIKGIIFDFDNTLTTENSITFLLEWKIRRYFESDNYFNPIKGALDFYKISFYGARYYKDIMFLFSKRNYNRPIEDIILKYGKINAKIYPHMLRSFNDLSKNDFEKISRLIPLRSGVKNLLINLKNRGIKIGISSMSLDMIIKNSLYFIELDYLGCNDIIFEDSTENAFVKKFKIKYWNAKNKENSVFKFCNIFNFKLSEVMYVGDDFHDILAADKAGIGLILLTSENKYLQNVQFFQKALKQYNFKLIDSISKIMDYLDLKY